MRAWQVESFEVPARLAECDIAPPAKGQALIRIHACGLNFADLLMARGKYQEMPDLPFVPGLECAGVVEALGPETTGPAPGTRIACYGGQGGLADYGLFDAARLIPLPDAMPFDDAAAFLVAYGTSHLALTHKARLAAGETLLVTGAAGGVGLTAVEIGKRMGARVIATARGAEKCEIARTAGADIAIDSETPDLKAQLRALGGIDVAYDAVGGDGFEAALRAMRPDGRILAIGFASGTVPQIPANHLLVKNVSVMGFWWGGYLHFAPDLLTDSLRSLFAWYQEGGLRPHISARLPLERLPEGLEMLKNRTATGKVVVVMA